MNKNNCIGKYMNIDCVEQKYLEFKNIYKIKIFDVNSQRTGKR